MAAPGKVATRGWGQGARQNDSQSNEWGTMKGGGVMNGVGKVPGGDATRGRG